MIEIIDEFDLAVEEAYLGRKRDVTEAAALLHIEAAELAELVLKKKWYNREFKDEDLLSEAGDILNFLMYILQQHKLTLEDAMSNNMNKLRERGYI